MIMMMMILILMTTTLEDLAWRDERALKEEEKKQSKRKQQSRNNYAILSSLIAFVQLTIYSTYKENGKKNQFGINVRKVCALRTELGHCVICMRQ